MSENEFAEAMEQVQENSDEEEETEEVSDNESTEDNAFIDSVQQSREENGGSDEIGETENPNDVSSDGLFDDLDGVPDEWEEPESLQNERCRVWRNEELNPTHYLYVDLRTSNNPVIVRTNKKHESHDYYDSYDSVEEGLEVAVETMQELSED